MKMLQMQTHNEEDNTSRYLCMNCIVMYFVQFCNLLRDSFQHNDLFVFNLVQRFTTRITTKNKRENKVNMNLKLF